MSTVREDILQKKAKPLKASEERFSELLATTDMTKTAAYIETHPENVGWTKKSLNEAASKLAAKCAPRIAELQEGVREAAAITVQSVAKKLNRAFSVAEKMGQGGAMSQAALGEAKLAGLLVERHIDETERSKSDADLAREIASIAPVEHREEVERIVIALLTGNPTPLVSVLERLERVKPKAA